MKKRLFSLILAVLIAFSIVGCTSDTSQGDTEPRSNRDTENPTTPNNPNTESPPQRLPPANLPLEPAEMFLYNYDNEHNGVRLTAYLGELTQLKIPDEIEGFPIVGITADVFKVGVVTDVAVPDSLVYWVWGGGNPDIERIIGELIIPYGVTEIVDIGTTYNFIRRYCLVSDVTRVIIPETVKIIGERAFENFNSLLSLIIPPNVTIIGEGAFMFCSSLVRIEIPDSVETIGNHAFAHCSSLTTITVGRGLESGLGDFSLNTSLMNIFVDEANAFYRDINGILFNKDMTTLIHFPINREETSYIVPDEVTRIDFIGGKNLSEIIIHDNVTNIGSISYTPWFREQADGIVYIGNIALAWKGTMPENTNLFIKEGTTVISSNAFNPGSVRSGSTPATALVSVHIPDTVRIIGSGAFARNEALENVVIPESVVEIARSAFPATTSIIHKGITYDSFSDFWDIFNS
jgi:hypothetical protein